MGVELEAHDGEEEEATEMLLLIGNCVDDKCMLEVATAIGISLCCGLCAGDFGR